VERVRMTAPNRIRLLGRVSQPELAALYRRAAVCVFPSRAEAFGLACAEAMSCAAAVVASSLGGGAELVEHGRSGLVVDPRDPAALLEAIEALIARPAFARSLGDAASPRVEEKYSIERAARATVEHYEQALRTKDAWRKKHVA
jgi:glycosyltransferase involved in cell wall biosynthesis